MGPSIDHIIVGLPYSELQNLPSWLVDNFLVTPGGRHADLKTENKLILFKDGSYIELIAFIDDDEEKKKGHWWGEHGSGFIDWALTSDSYHDVHQVNNTIPRANPGLEGAKYQPPQEGGRVKPDGTEIKWKVSFPEHVRRGEVPFWCHDVTPRELRVPTDESLTTHPCGATGVGRLSMRVPEAKLGAFEKFYTAVLGEQGRTGSQAAKWTIGTVASQTGARRPEVEIHPDSTLNDKHAVISKLTLFVGNNSAGDTLSTINKLLGGEEVQIHFERGS